MEQDLDPEPRWPALLALLAAGVLNLALPSWVNRGPRGLLLLIVMLLSIPTHLFHRAGKKHLNHAFGFLNLTVLTLGLLGSLWFLVDGMPTHQLSAEELLKAAADLWITNVLVFSLWYWRLDAGGPNHRDTRVGHKDGSFLFPQMSMSPEMLKEADMENWSPGFMDYLFVAFNASTALSPTDAPILTRWAKGLMMIQALISLSILVLLVARAINTLQ